MDTLIRVYGGCSIWSRDSIKSSRIAHCQFRYTAKAALITLERVFVYCSGVAQGPEVKRRKNQAPFLNTLVGGLPLALWYFPGTCERCRPSLNALIDSVSAKEF